MGSLKIVKLDFKDEFSDKTYIIHLVVVEGKGFQVVAKYGKQGAPNNTAIYPQHPVGLGEATEIFDKLIQKKLKKGYTKKTFL